MNARYTRTAAWLHWIIGALIIANLVIAFSDGRVGTIRAHKAIGITVLVLSLVRLGWRLTHRPPPFPDDVTPAERVLATGVHAIFYALMIIVPLAGWLFVSNARELRPLSWFGLFPIPYLKLSPVIYALARYVLEWLGIGFAVLIAGHVAAALRHQRIGRDRLLARMNPV
ncbi:cytochrome b [Sphingomonas ginkgonis]|uniref:cytochrome b n=1 Tax=Sphingomonas ginkgonis TaxID=2315330 RepID=UPI001EF04679|nr:cytochrome b [Sphingomonas ginkgonis]